MAEPQASRLRHDPGEVLRWREICGPALLCVGGHANPCRRIVPARPFRRSALWEQNVQRFNNQLNPAVLFDGQDGDDLGAGGYEDGDHCCSGRIHVKYGICRKFSCSREEFLRT